jgi:hypothetical protein
MMFNQMLIKCGLSFLLFISLQALVNAQVPVGGQAHRFYGVNSIVYEQVPVVDEEEALRNRKSKKITSEKRLTPEEKWQLREALKNGQ